MCKAAFIINPVSGLSHKDHLRDQIVQGMRKHQAGHEILFTQYPLHAYHLAREYVGKGFDIIVAVGGDGTVNEIAHALVHTSVKMGIIPTGSGNGLAHFLGLPFNIEKAIDNICQANTKAIDTMLVNQKRFVNVAGVGFDAMISRKFAAMDRRGFWSYFKLVLQEYSGYVPRKYLIEYQGKQIQRTPLLIAFANSNQFGNNAIIAPQARIDDGLIDVCILTKVSLLQAPMLGRMLMFNPSKQNPFVEYLRVPELMVTQQNDGNCHIDGEPFECGKKLNIQVDSLSLNIIVPSTVK
ncbi:MAG: diacylglycerol kinase family lipid kinase [Bacteroidales bacterium]